MKKKTYNDTYYQIVKALSPKALEHLVNEEIKVGWVLAGGLNTYPCPQTNILVFSQALVRG